jgi:DNA-binding CsgD family transcriptional regulator
VLERLLAGDSERQAAMSLKMTEHAVHAHVKALHKQFGVRSRGELLARFIEPGGPTKAK